MNGEVDDIIQVQNVSFCYPGAEANALNGVNLSIKRGDFVAVIGSNGSGKSTLCKCLNGLIPTYYTGDFEGEVIVNGKATKDCTIAQLSKQVAYVFQDFENQLVRPTVFDELSFTPLNFGYEDYNERAIHALQMLDMMELKNRWIWQLSGGQKHMTALAAALSLDPEIIIVDEPVAQLDPAHAKLFYEKLRFLNEHFGKTIIVIEHHTEFIAEYCNNVILLDRGGKVRWTKPTNEALSSVDELLALHIQPPQVTQAYISLFPEQKGEKLLPVTIEQAKLKLAPYLQAKLEAKASDDKDDQLQHPSEDYQKQAKSTPLMDSRHQNLAERKPLIHIEQASCGYQAVDRSRKATLKQIDMTVHQGERIALVGNNGAGKSTLLRLIAGIRKPWSGSVHVCGHHTAEVTPEKLANHVAFIFQQPEEMFITDHIKEDISYFLKTRKHSKIEPFIEHIMDTFHLTELAQKDGRLLSGGQQRRATLAIGMAMRPTVMLLDEPTASLDIVSRREMTTLFDELQDHVQAIIVATHDMQLVADWATRVIVMHDGEIIMDGSSEEVFQSPEILEKAALIPPQIVQLSHALHMSPPAKSVAQFAQQWNDNVHQARRSVLI